MRAARPTRDRRPANRQALTAKGVAQSVAPAAERVVAVEEAQLLGAGAVSQRSVEEALHLKLELRGTAVLDGAPALPLAHAGRVAEAPVGAGQRHPTTITPTNQRTVKMMPIMTIRATMLYPMIVTSLTMHVGR